MPKDPDIDPGFERIVAEGVISDRTGDRLWQARMANGKEVSVYAPRKMPPASHPEVGETVLISFPPVNLDTGRLIRERDQ